MNRLISRPTAIVVAAAVLVAAVATTTVTAQAFYRLPGWGITPPSGPLGTTFTGDIEWPSGVPGQPPDHGCASVVSYTVTDPNGDQFAQGDIPANIPGPVIQSFSFQVTVASPSPLGTYSVSGVCDGSIARGQFDVVGPPSPPPDILTVAPASQSQSVDNRATISAVLTDGTSRQPIGGIALSFTVSGANGGSTGSCFPVSCGTDSAGQVTFTYAGSHIGDDLVFAQIGPSPLNTGPSALASVTWTPTLNGSAYAALGDSFSAGEGTGSYVVGTDLPGYNMCHRSDVAYGPLVDSDRSLGPIAFVACSGAVTADLFRPNHANNLTPADIAEPAQLCQVSSSPSGPQACPPSVLPALGVDTKTVTLTIGGNDAGFTTTVASCVWGSKLHGNFGQPGRGCSTQPAVVVPVMLRLAALAGLTRQTVTTSSEDGGSAIRSIPSVLAAIHQGAPNARVFVAGYPRLFGNVGNRDCLVGVLQTVIGGVDLKITPDDARWLDDSASLLDTILSRSAAAAGSWATYVDVQSSFAGHGVCSASPWINHITGSIPGTDLSQLHADPSSLHPTQPGQVLGYEPAFIRAKIGK